jgi:large subunit ribosomal protein L20
MPRAKRTVASRARRRKVLRQAKGYFGSRHRLYRQARETLYKAMEYSYRDRRVRKRDFRRLWITRINAALRAEGTSYSRFMYQLKNSQVDLDRKMLADLAARDPRGFHELVKSVTEAQG